MRGVDELELTKDILLLVASNVYNYFALAQNNQGR